MLQYNPFQLTDEVKALQSRATELQLALGEARAPPPRRLRGRHWLGAGYGGDLGNSVETRRGGR